MASDPFTLEQDSAGQAKELALLKGIVKRQELQLAAMEDLKETLTVDIAGVLIRLDQRPELDVDDLKRRMDEAIDSVDRVTRQRIPRLVSRRWYVAWLWLMTGLLLGIMGYHAATQTALGKQALALILPHAQPLTPRKGK